MKLDLTADEKDLLAEVLTHSGWSILLRAIEQIIEGESQRVTSFNLDQDRSQEKLANELARLQGSWRLYRAIRDLRGTKKRPSTASKKH